jgi:hypothetical protein
MIVNKIRKIINTPTMITKICNKIYHNEVEDLKTIEIDYDDSNKNIQHHIKLAIMLGYTSVLEYLHEQKKLKHIELYHECTKHINSFKFFKKETLIHKVKDKYLLLLNILEDNTNMIYMWEFCKPFLNQLTDDQKNNLLIEIIKEKPITTEYLYIINDIISTHMLICPTIEYYFFNLNKIKNQELNFLLKNGFYCTIIVPNNGCATNINTFESFHRLEHMDLSIDSLINSKYFRSIIHYIKEYKKKILLISP